MHNIKIIKKYVSIYFLILMIFSTFENISSIGFVDIIYLLVVFYVLIRVQFIKD